MYKRIVLPWMKQNMRGGDALVSANVLNNWCAIGMFLLLQEGDKDLGAGYYGEEEETTGIYPGM